MEEKQKTTDIQNELAPEEQKVAVQVTYALHALASYEPGEQEAVAQAARDAGLMAEAIDNYVFRRRITTARAVIVTLIWLLFCMSFKMFSDFVMMLAFGTYVKSSGVVGHLLGIVAGMAIFRLSQSQRCLEWGIHIRMGYLTLPCRVFVAVGLLVVSWLMALGVVRYRGPLFAYQDLVLIENLTAFILSLLAYLVTVCLVGTFMTTRQQMLREEKWKLGIFD